MSVCTNPNCDTKKPVFSRGLCQSCYNRQRRRGTLERAYVVNVGVCTHHGCTKPTFAKNLCQEHYGKAQDPMRYMWRNLRSRYPGQFPETWTTFEGFMADVPCRPADAIQLRRSNVSQPWSATNMHWQVPVTSVMKRSGQSLREYMSDYSKEWTDKTRYGVTKEERERMMEAQDGRCAICREPETAPNHHHPDRVPRRLNIDHNHKTGKVRGLLCAACNTALGKFRDDPEVLASAIAYLKKHSA